MLENENLGTKAVNGFFWKFMEKAGMQIMQFIIQIVLARVLFPREYGLVGLLTIFIIISDVFIQQGFTTALIQKKNADQLDFSSVFYANIALSVIIYIVLYILAPVIASFYSEEILKGMMRILSLNVLFGAISAVHNAILARMLDFKKSFYRGLFNILTQGVVGVTLAVKGFGAWSLVFSKIAGTLVGSLILILTVQWKPTLEFSLYRIRTLFTFSSKILGVNLLNTVFNNIHSLIIGRFFSSADLGFYQRGQQIPQAIMTAVDGSMSEVLYPTLSIVQSDLSRLKSALRRSMKLSMFLTFPIITGLMVVARPITIILLTDKWLPSVPYMQLSCIICLFWPMAARNHALNAIGRSDITFRISLISKALTLACIFASIKSGIYAVMIGTILSSVISFWITSYYINKYIQYSLLEIMGDIWKSLVASICMMVVVIVVGKLPVSTYMLLPIQVVIGVLSYSTLSYLLKNESLQYVLNTGKKFLK